MSERLYSQLTKAISTTVILAVISPIVSIVPAQQRPTLRTDGQRYPPSEKVVVYFSGLPSGNDYQITIVTPSHSDNATHHALLSQINQGQVIGGFWVVSENALLLAWCRLASTAPAPKQAPQPSATPAPADPRVSNALEGLYVGYYGSHTAAQERHNVVRVGTDHKAHLMFFAMDLTTGACPLKEYESRPDSLPACHLRGRLRVGTLFAKECCQA